MEEFSLLIKPASADCNLSCRYCFYLDRAGLYPGSRQHRMSEPVLRAVVEKYMATEQSVYGFGWQGGEPTLMGSEFFQLVTGLQAKYGRSGAVVSNGLQTNGILIDDRLARHLAEYRFLVGVSLDGPAAIHDRYRKKVGGQGSHADVIRGIRRLESHEVEFNILVLVSDANAGKAREVYDYLCDNGWHFHQYIPCVELDADGRPLPFSLSGEQWGEFLCALFDRWMESGRGQGQDRGQRQKPGPDRVSIRLFDALLARLLDGTCNLCHLGRDCRQYYLVEHNGDVYPCDFFVQSDLRLGNLLEQGWTDLHRSPVYRDFGKRKSAWNPTCSACDFLELCAGDCLKHRGRGSIADSQKLSLLCAGWKRFFAHALPRLESMAEEMKGPRGAKRPEGAKGAIPMPSTGRRPRKPGRNDPCPCGSGKKYKKCCLGRQPTS
jgi:uncharacterized protein